MISPPHAPLRQTSIPPAAPTAMSRGGSVNGEILRQGSPQSSSTSGNKISIPKAMIDLVADQEKEREKEDKEALVVRLPSKMLRKYSVRILYAALDALRLSSHLHFNANCRSSAKAETERVCQSKQ